MRELIGLFVFTVAFAVFVGLVAMAAAGILTGILYLSIQVAT
jgi:hypothetical protein